MRYKRHFFLLYNSFEYCCFACLLTTIDLDFISGELCDLFVVACYSFTDNNALNRRIWANLRISAACNLNRNGIVIFPLKFCIGWQWRLFFEHFFVIRHSPIVWLGLEPPTNILILFSSHSQHFNYMTAMPTMTFLFILFLHWYQRNRYINWHLLMFFI